MRWAGRDLKDHLIISMNYFGNSESVQREAELQGWPYTVCLHVFHLEELLLGQGQVSRALQQQAGGAPQN